MNMKDAIEIFGAVLLVIGVLVIITFLLTLPTYWLWNWLMPVIFGFGRITIWQAFGLNLLCRILFKNSNITSKKQLGVINESYRGLGWSIVFDNSVLSRNFLIREENNKYVKTKSN